MTNILLTKLKIIIKRWLGRCVYFCCYFKDKLYKFISSTKKRISPPLNAPNLIKTAYTRWKLILYIITIFLICYYGCGAVISSRFNNRLETPLKADLTPGQYTVSALSHVIKTQIDGAAWTPALPIIFPAAILDNLPNFQLGTKDSVHFFIKNLAGRTTDSSLQKASDLLSYPPDIWLFSQDKEDKLSPGSAKQYRKALSEMEHFINKNKNNTPTSYSDLSNILKDSILLIEQKITVLEKHIQEHNSETADFRADDIFYQTQGSVYTLHYLLSALVHDYKTQILELNQYENLTSALKFLADAAKIKPLIIKNASFTDSYAANHLAYLSYYLAQAQNKLQEINHQIFMKTLEPQPCISNETN